MGIVIAQSVKNVITTYLGFAIGALNTLFLYVNFMTDEYYGLVGFLVSTAMILMPFMAFGVHNTIVKFYSSYEGQEQELFTQFMLFLPIAVIIPGALICYFFYGQIASFLASKNEIVTDYIWYIFIIAVSSAYFEVFYAWAKVHYKTVFGNFMKEVFHRIGITILLILLALDLIDIQLFLKCLVGVYVLRVLLMKVYAFRLKMPVLKAAIKMPHDVSKILKYTSLIIIAGSIATMLLDIDKVMIGKYVAIENVAYYAVAIYMATVIAVPVRAMHQITYPMVAEMLNTKRYDEMKVLYQRSSLTLYVISGLLFLLIVCNLNAIYELVDPAYRTGLYVVLLIGLARIFDNVLGINNAILFNSDYYRIVLILGVILVVLAIILNMIFIPMYGINGAAIATFTASVCYGLSKVIVVYWKFRILPFSRGTLKMSALLVFLFLGFFFWEFPFYPLLSIALKTILLSFLFLGVVYGFQISADINKAIDRFLKKKSRPA